MYVFKERPRKRARTTNGSNTSAGNGERPNNNSSRNNASRSDNERQGTSSSSASTGGSTKATGKGSGNGGAIIESMHHHGKGVYSGTFSGMIIAEWKLQSCDVYNKSTTHYPW